MKGVARFAGGYLIDFSRGQGEQGMGEAKRRKVLGLTWRNRPRGARRPKAQAPVKLRGLIAARNARDAELLAHLQSCAACHQLHEHGSGRNWCAEGQALYERWSAAADVVDDWRFDSAERRAKKTGVFTYKGIALF